MIAFASLILGLVTGVVPIRVAVSGPIASIEIELDGSSVGRRISPPWTLDVDFGKDLAPHQLIARGFDRDGNEVGSVKQWVNLPRPPAEITILPERDATGRVASARLAWQSLLGPHPTDVRVTFDRRPLVLSGDRVTIPEFDAASTHILSAELDFPLNLRSRQDLVLGGGSAGEARTELTAVPVRVKDGKLPPPQALQGWLEKKGEALTVTAAEHGPADVLIVRDLTTDEAARRLALPPVYAGGFARITADSRLEARLAGEDRAQIVWPIARRYRTASEADSELFEVSRVFRPREAGIHWLLSSMYYPSPSPSLPTRFADAVAVAGLQAFSGYSRRAVVLVLGSSSRDESRWSPGAVRRYFEEIHVPLVVWSIVKPDERTSSRWGPVEEVSSYWKLRKAVARLKDDLASQSIIWVAGRHLPQEIGLTERARGIEIVR